MDVDVVARRAGLVRGGPAGAAVADRPLAPVGVDLGIGIAGEDVGDDVGRLLADDLGRLDLVVGRRPDLLAARVDDRLDELAGMSLPPSAMAPYAESMSIGCVSRVPMPSDTTGAALL